MSVKQKPVSRCYACKSEIKPLYLPYYWISFRGYERAHCSGTCRAKTRERARKEQEKGLQEIMK